MSIVPSKLRLALASGNAHKLREFQGLGAAAGAALEIISPNEFGGMPSVAEDTGTFAGNAGKKAKALKAKLPPEVWALADDSGLCVDALGGAPGVESAYYAGPAGDPAANLARLVRSLHDVPESSRGAHFICVLALAGPGGEERLFEGRCDGRLLPSARGGGGFGYDPIFVPRGGERTFAELAESEKSGISHRARAWERLLAWVRNGDIA